MVANVTRSRKSHIQTTQEVLIFWKALTQATQC